MRSASAKLSEMIERKEASLLESVSPGKDAIDALAVLSEMAESIAKYNESVRLANNQFASHLRAIEGRNVEELQTYLANLEVAKSRYLPSTAAACEALSKLYADQAKLASEKQTARDALEEHVLSISTEYERELNRCLEKFNARFRIRGTKADFHGGVPTSNYHLDVDGHEVNIGNSKTELGVPSFKNTLSGGDRSALALAFFMADLTRATSPQNLPLFSMILFSLKIAFDAIRQRTE